MIILEPQGGLANRMRVIASGFRLMKESNQELEVIWNLKDELNCEYSKLFDPIIDLKITSKQKRYNYVKATNQNKFYKWALALTINKIINIDYCIKEGDFSKLIWNNKIDILKISKKNKNIYIQTYEEFGENFNQFAKFKPVFEIQNSIDDQVQHFDKDTIGIHIRRSDNKKAIEQSPLELFVNRIEFELEINLNANFFLATDDLFTERKLKELYGKKILTYKKELTRNTNKGIIDAVVDMYCLSSTKYIYGSYWSSFSDIASRVGNIELKILRKD